MSVGSAWAQADYDLDTIGCAIPGITVSIEGRSLVVVRAWAEMVRVYEGGGLYSDGDVLIAVAMCNGICKIELPFLGGQGSVYNRPITVYLGSQLLLRL